MLSIGGPLTPARCRDLQPGQMIRDDKVPGLSLQARPSRKTWYLYYRTRDGQERRPAIGTFPAINVDRARDTARDLLQEVAKGHDPSRQWQEAREAKAGVLAFPALFGAWLEKHAKRNKRSWREDERLYNSCLAQRLGTDLSRAAFATALDDVAVVHGGVTANRCCSLVSAVCNFAVSEGALAASPVYRLRKRVRETPRQRVMTDAELTLLWHAKLPRPQQLAIRLLMLTGQRCSEVAGICAIELVEPGLWVIPSVRTKNGRAHAVPLPPLAARLAQQLTHVARPHAKTLSHIPAKLRAGDAHWVYCQCSVLDPENPVCWTLHDIRRTCKTRWAAKPMSLSQDLSDRITNHVSGRGVGASVYNQHSYLDERRDALDTWARQLSAIVAAE